MPIYKSIQYSVYCELCLNLEDFESYEKPKRDITRLGWKLINRFPDWTTVTDCLTFCPKHTNEEINAFIVEIEKRNK